MKNYRVSPLLLFAALIVGAIITLLVAPFPDMGENVVYYLVAAIPVSLLVDLLFQKNVKSNAILWIAECFIILIILIITSEVLYG